MFFSNKLLSFVLDLFVSFGLVFLLLPWSGLASLQIQFSTINPIYVRSQLHGCWFLLFCDFGGCGGDGVYVTVCMCVVCVSMCLCV